MALKDTIGHAIPLISLLKSFSDIAFYHAASGPKNRLSQTRRCLSNCFRFCVDLSRDVYDNRTFAYRLRDVLLKADDGSCVVQFDIEEESGSVYIEGSFNIDLLRNWLLASSTKQIELENGEVFESNTEEDSYGE